MPRSLEADYIAALEHEIAAFRWPWIPETVYLGGGTPSGIEPGDFQRLLSHVPGRPWIEATIEAAPGTIGPERVRCWIAAGITRVSLGVQSFSAKELARTGRKHRAETVAADVRVLRDCGVAHINIDLIAGLPGQTCDSWRESLEWITRLEPDHVSVYMLEVDEDSRLGREILSGGNRFGAFEVPGEELTTELYERAVDWLAAIGLMRYEISNFARAGCESAHNLKYWRLEPYAGFGADAHSFDGQYRCQNVESAREYVDRFRAGLAPASCSQEARRDEERFFVGLRLLAGMRPLADEWERYAEPIGRFIRDGLLQRDGDLLRLTRRGVLLSNEVFSEFIQI